MSPEENELVGDLSASFYRQMFFIRLCKIENEWFAGSAHMEKPIFKSIHRVIKNTIATITASEEQAKKALPLSQEKISRVVDNDKLLVMSSIVEKMSYMSIEQLEEMDEHIKLTPENESVEDSKNKQSTLM